MSKKLSSFFIANEIIKEEDKEVYEYSFELLLSTVLNFIAVIAIAIVTGKIFESTLFVLGFVPLRALAGGYHADTHFRCFLILLVNYSLFLLIVFFMPVRLTLITEIILTVISILLIFILAPVENSNRPFSDQERKTLKRKSRTSILIYSLIVICLSFILSNKVLGFSLAFGIFSVSFSMFASVIKNRITKTDINA